jgi:hypothetical protein
MKAAAGFALALLATTGPALAQVDPQAVLDLLLGQALIERQQRFEDRQRQRFLDEQEQAYDREMCLRVGYRGPDVEQCVRDSAAWRRGVRPGQQFGQPSMGSNCSTIPVGNGFSTICD